MSEVNALGHNIMSVDACVHMSVYFIINLHKTNFPIRGELVELFPNAVIITSMSLSLSPFLFVFNVLGA